MRWAVLLGAFLRASAGVPDVRLSNGVEMPVLAFAAQLWDAQTCKEATTEALKAGFRFIWSSALVGADCQSAQKAAISSSGMRREDLFIAGTVNTQSCQDADSCYKETKSGAAAQLKHLGVDALDMLMLDYPSSAGCAGIGGQWQAFEEAYSAKLARTIAVSNFGPDQLKCVFANASRIAPTVNQLQYSVGHGQDTAVADNAKLGVVVQAYSPLGTGALAHDKLCTQIGSAHNKSSVQVALKWILQRNATVATQSTKPQHLVEDLDLFDFTLSPDEMSQLNSHSLLSQAAVLYA